MTTREKVYNFIVEYQTAHDGATPSIAQIGAAVGRSSGSVVHHIIRDPRLVRIGPGCIQVGQAQRNVLLIAAVKRLLEARTRANATEFEKMLGELREMVEESEGETE